LLGRLGTIQRQSDVIALLLGEVVDGRFVVFEEAADGVGAAHASHDEVIAARALNASTSARSLRSSTSVLSVGALQDRCCGETSPSTERLLSV